MGTIGQYGPTRGKIVGTLVIHAHFNDQTVITVTSDELRNEYGHDCGH